jgi:hypothetical protein
VVVTLSPLGIPRRAATVSPIRTAKRGVKTSFSFPSNFRACGRRERLWALHFRGRLHCTCAHLDAQGVDDAYAYDTNAELRV